MRKLILQVVVMSLDGFVADDESDLGKFTDIDDQPLAEWLTGLIWQAETHIMGRTTYESMAEHWPDSTEIFAAPMNSIPKVVFSKSLERAEWTDSTIARGDTVEEIRRLKDQTGGDILAHGGVKFLQSLAGLEVVDAYRLLVYPYVAGGGQALFAGVEKPRGLALVDSVSFSSGVLGLTYRPN
jgi:dihydrofolate reductase